MLWESYFAPHDCDHLTNAAAVAKAREDFLKRRPRNLEFLLRKRYEWMNEYADGKDRVIDLGCGIGLSREFIRNPRVLLTDINDYPWIDRKVDALALPFKEDSVDVFICGHIVHHLAHPLAFFDTISRLLKPGGYALIQEIETSLFLKLLLRLRGIEGWDDRAPVFDRAASCTKDREDPWSANCAIPRLLFRDPERFERAVPGLKIVRNEPCECLIFPLSGGVLAKVPSLPLPPLALELVDALDDLAVSLSPDLFSLGRKVALQRRPAAGKPAT